MCARDGRLGWHRRRLSDEVGAVSGIRTLNQGSRSRGMKILVTFAIGSEFAAWRRQHDFRQVAHDPYPVYVAEIEGSTVRVVLTGVGNEAAEAAVRWALSAPVDVCITSGFAGALNPEYVVGNVLSARVVLWAERELAVASDRELLSVARDAGARQADHFLTAAVMFDTPQQKMAYASEADAVDMESFVILAEAARHGVRAVALRAVSDAADSGLPYDFGRVLDARGQVRVGRLLLELARRPQRIPALLRLAHDCRSAASELADFLDAYVKLLHVRFDLSHSEMIAAT